MDEVCTTAFDGECEVYKRFGLDRVVVNGGAAVEELLATPDGEPLHRRPIR